MTRVEIIKSRKDSSYLSFSVKGHSGYGDFGEDIVCAAISFLTINTVNSLTELTDDEIDADMNEAAVEICCRFKKPLSLEANILMQSFELGMKQLSDKKGEYREFVNLTIKEV